jgi:hypothetical protein
LAHAVPLRGMFAAHRRPAIPECCRKLQGKRVRRHKL